MAKEKYALNPGEKVIYKATGVRHGVFGPFTNILTVTNQSVIWEKYGMLNNFKEIERFDYSSITQAIQGKAFNDEPQLEIYINGKIEEFSLQDDDNNALKVLVMAINDQMGQDAEHFDFSYYQSLVEEAKDTERLLELRARAKEDEADMVSGSPGLDIFSSAATNLLKSGDFSAKGLTKAVTKATNKQKRNSIFSGMMDGLLDDIGIRDLQDEFTEIGNEFREEFGLKPKMTHAERKELMELEEKRKQQEIQRQKDVAFQNKVMQQKTKIDAMKNTTSESSAQNASNAKLSVKEQMELLQQIKGLLDAGVLTQDEFDKKKQEILNS